MERKKRTISHYFFYDVIESMFFGDINIEQSFNLPGHRRHSELNQCLNTIATVKYAPKR